MADLAEKLRRAAQHGYAANPGDHSDLLRQAAAALEAAREGIASWRKPSPYLHSCCREAVDEACQDIEAAIDQARGKGIVPEQGEGNERR